MEDGNEYDEFMDGDGEGDDGDSVSYEFELRNSVDGKLVILSCSSSRAMSPEEYAIALKNYAERIEAVINMTDISGTLN